MDHFQPVQVNKLFTFKLLKVAIIPSTYLSLAETTNMQFMLDRSQDVLDAQSIWRTFLDVAPAQMSLTFDSIIARDRISAVASIVDQDSPAPLRSRPTVEQYQGKIPTMKEKFRLNQSDMRAIEIVRTLPVIAGGNTNQLVEFLLRDLSEAAVSGEKRIDLMLLQAMSTFSVDLSITGNPDGVAAGSISLLPQSYQTQGVPVVWTDAANATPLDDIQNYIEWQRNTRGRLFGAIYMSYELWLVFRKTAQVKSYLQTFFNVGKVSASFAVTLANVNEYLAANLLPPIYIINYTSMVETDGVAGFVKGFSTTNVLFAPSGKIGTLANAVPMERLYPVDGKNYANYGPTLVSKWREDDPLVEFTGMEMLAFPVLTIDSLFLLATSTVLANFV